MYDQLFQLSNLLVVPFWLLMIFLPFWGWTKRIISSPWIAAPTALLYTALVLPSMMSLFAQIANPELAQIAVLLGTPAGATIAWAHFVTVDLFAGRWIYLDSRERGITAWLVSPILFFVSMFAPFGLLLYLVARLFTTRQSA